MYFISKNSHTVSHSTDRAAIFIIYKIMSLPKNFVISSLLFIQPVLSEKQPHSAKRIFSFSMKGFRTLHGTSEQEALQPNYPPKKQKQNHRLISLYQEYLFFASYDIFQKPHFLFSQQKVIPQINQYHNVPVHEST